MKRRTPTSTSAPPQELLRFELERWGSVRAVSAAFERWTSARAAWVAEGNEWPGGLDEMHRQQLAEAIALPDEELRL